MLMKYFQKVRTTLFFNIESSLQPASRWVPCATPWVKDESLRCTLELWRPTWVIWKVLLVSLDSWRFLGEEMRLTVVKGEGLSNFGVVECCFFLMVVDVGVCILYMYLWIIRVPLFFLLPAYVLSRQKIEILPRLFANQCNPLGSLSHATPSSSTKLAFVEVESTHWCGSCLDENRSNFRLIMDSIHHITLHLSHIKATPHRCTDNMLIRFTAISF